MEGQITLQEWMEWKEDIRRKLQETTENFVYIGYRLKQIRDTEAFKMAGAEDIYSFAQQEYGLHRSTVSRFMAINDKFSEKGNSIELKKEFAGLGSSKLQEMLSLTDEECTLITEHTTVRQIKDFKEFKRQDPEVIDKEGQPMDSLLERVWSPLEKCIIDYFSTREEMLNEAAGLMQREKSEEIVKRICEVINPSENGSHKKGIIFLFFYDYSTGVKCKVLGQDEIKVYSWMEFVDMIAQIYGEYSESTDNIWMNFYGTEKKPENTINTGTDELCDVAQNEDKKDEGKCSEEVKKEEKQHEKSTEAAGVPEEIGPERLPKGKLSGDGISWKEPEKKEYKPVELPPADAEYALPMGNSMLKDIKAGQRYLILKMHDLYRVGNILHLREQTGGEETGNGIDIRITHMTDDHGGIADGYCVIQFDILPVEEKQLPGQLNIEDMEGIKDAEISEENETKKEPDCETDRIYSEGQESDT